MWILITTIILEFYIIIDYIFKIREIKSLKKKNESHLRVVESLTRAIPVGTSVKSYSFDGDFTICRLERKSHGNISIDSVTLKDDCPDWVTKEMIEESYLSIKK